MLAVGKEVAAVARETVEQPWWRKATELISIYYGEGFYRRRGRESWLRRVSGRTVC